jgi:hypothetical protein
LQDGFHSEARIKAARLGGSGMHAEPAIVRALGGRLWSGLVVTIGLLGLTAVFGVLVDAGWPLGKSFAGAALAGTLLGLGGVLVRQRIRGEASP